MNLERITLHFENLTGKDVDDAMKELEGFEKADLKISEHRNEGRAIIRDRFLNLDVTIRFYRPGDERNIGDLVNRLSKKYPWQKPYTAKVLINR